MPMIKGKPQLTAAISLGKGVRDAISTPIKRYLPHATSKLVITIMGAVLVAD